MKKLLITITLTALMSCVSPVEEPATMARIETIDSTLRMQGMRGTHTIHVYDTFWQPVAVLDSLFDTTVVFDDLVTRSEPVVFGIDIEFDVYNIVHEYMFFWKHYYSDTLLHYSHTAQDTAILDTLSTVMKDWFELYPK